MTWRIVLRDLCVVLMLVFLLDRLCGWWVLPCFDPSRPPNGRPGKLRSSTAYAHLRAVSLTEADCLILGSSRALSNYDDVLLSRRTGLRVYNGGTDGAGLLQARAAFAFAQARYRPRLVLFDTVFIRYEDRQIHRLDPWFGTHPVVDDLLRPQSWREQLKFQSYAYRCAGSMVELIQDYGKAPRRSGYLPREEVWLPPGPAAHNERDNGIPLPQWYWDSLEKFAREVRAAGGQLVLVMGPTWTRTLPDLPGLVEQPQRDWARAHGVPVLELGLQQIPVLEKPGYFADPLHLNRHGAEIFSTQLASRLTSLLSSPAAP